MAASSGWLQLATWATAAAASSGRLLLLGIGCSSDKGCQQWGISCGSCTGSIIRMVAADDEGWLTWSTAGWLTSAAQELSRWGRRQPINKRQNFWAAFSLAIALRLCRAQCTAERRPPLMAQPVARTCNRQLLPPGRSSLELKIQTCH